MNRIKQLNEQRGAKLKEAAALSTDKTEDRAKIATLHTEIEGIDQAIILEARQLELLGQKPIVHSEGEKRDLARFDYNKVLNHLVRTCKGQPSKIEGIEAEMAQEGETEARSAGIEIGGLMLPRRLVRANIERRDVSATGTTSVTGDQGGMTIATGKAGLLDDFYNASVLRAAGATVLEGLVGNLDIPRLVADTTKPLKKTENESAAEYTPTTAMLSLNPNRLPAFIDIGEQLLKQSSSAIEAILRSCLTNEMTAVQEAAFFHGGGTSEANGVIGTTGIGDVAGGTDGAAPTLAHLVELETDVDTVNALLGNLRYISNGQVRGKLKQTPVVVDQCYQPNAHQGRWRRRLGLLGDLLW
jgi:HK97 family phage major capsid protein